MEDFLQFCQANNELVFSIMVVLVVVLTAVFKLPIKHATKNMPAKKKEAVNGTITVLTVVVGCLVELAYALITKTPYDIKLAGLLGTVGAGSYNFYEVPKNIIKYWIDCRKNGKKITKKGTLDALNNAKISDETEPSENSSVIVNNIMEDFDNNINNITNNE